MKIYLTEHALKRIAERKVTKQQLVEAFKKPFATLPTKDPQRRRIMARIGEQTLDIIYVPRRGKMIIVTVAWLNEEDRKICP